MYEDYTPSPLTTWTQRVVSHLERDPEAIALVEATTEGARTWTRARFSSMVAGSVDLLRAESSVSGCSVPALLTTRPTSVALLVAGALADRPLAPLAPRMTEPELLACLTRMPGDVLLAEPAYADLAARLGAEVRRRVVVVDREPAGDHPLEPGTDSDRVALTMHTSGTTGLPKRVDVREFPLGRRADVNGYLLDLHPADRMVATSLFHHVGGLGNIAVALGNGASLAVFPSFSVDAWRALEAVRPTHCVTIPTVFEMLLAEDALASASLRVLGYGASPIHPDTMRRVQEVMPHVDFVNLFGQTEGSPVSVLTAADHRLAAGERPDLLRSVGRAAPGTELRLESPDEDGVGEVWARSLHSFVVDEQGWQRTGDLARIDEDGYVFLVGRRGDKIIRGGENVYPIEVEQVLLTHPAVREVAVVGVPDQRLGETVTAFLVAAGASPDPAELRAYARARLAGFKVPVAWEFVEALPRNPNGKVLRRELTARAAQAGL
ncbi:fatty acid--CoA ligase family protein [Pseudonocardia sp. NPDC049154]|uniref:class I adenylate-forming enzyme family protein n=1 Tax=Pseudonocardia sp. NPDC049154 TaxID=3155501 RepID=UPI0033F787AE